MMLQLGAGSDNSSRSLPLRKLLACGKRGDDASPLAACGCRGFFGVVMVSDTRPEHCVADLGGGGDAKSRGMDNSILWMVLVMLTGIIGLIIYLLVRRKATWCPARIAETSGYK